MKKITDHIDAAKAELEKAKATHAAAKEAESMAQATDDQSKTAKSRAALKAAEDAVADAERDIKSAQRILAKAEERQAEIAKQAARDAYAAKDNEYTKLHTEIREDEATDVVAALVAAARAQAGRNAKIAKLRECGTQLARMQSEIDGIPYNEAIDALRRNEPVGTLNIAILLFRDALNKSRETDPELYKSGHELYSRLTADWHPSAK